MPRKSVLVIVGDRAALGLFEQLTSLGWKVDYAADNDGALCLLNIHQYDLVITAESTRATEDIELLRRIRKIHPHTRMIILTNESTASDVISALRARAFSYFSTPYSTDDLCEMVRLALETPCWDDGIEVISATPAWIRLLVRCDSAIADRMLQFFSEMIDLPEPERGQVAYAFREMLFNAIRHGGRFDPSQFVEISYVRARRMVGCKVKDPGEGFRLDELYHAAVSNPPDDPVRHMLFREAAGLPPGGYGILLSQHLVDELFYNETGNEVLLVKYLNSSETPLVSTSTPSH